MELGEKLGDFCNCLALAYLVNDGHDVLVFGLKIPLHSHGLGTVRIWPSCIDPRGDLDSTR